MRFKPTNWASMPLSARKCFLRTRKASPSTDGRIRGWEWFVTYAEPDKVYAASRDMRWFVAQSDKETVAALCA